MFTSSPTWRLKMHVLCKVRKNIIFQKKTLLVMFYRHNKTFWYQFCNFKHFLKAKNSEDSLASLWLSIGLSCNPVWDWVTVGTRFKLALAWVFETGCQLVLSHNSSWPLITKFGGHMAFLSNWTSGWSWLTCAWPLTPAMGYALVRGSSYQNWWT